MKTLYFISILAVLLSCKQKKNSSFDKDSTNQIKPKELLQKTIDAHGGAELFKNSLIKFKIDNTFFSLQYDNYGRADFEQIRFRDNKEYKLTYKQGFIQYYINDSIQPEESYSLRMAESSLFGFSYTSSMPFNLTTNDVKISKLANVTIRQKEYYTLDVQFSEIQDQPEDRFLLYIEKDTKQIEYIALKQDLSGPIAQFRRMINPRRVHNILFQDYISFNPNDTITPLEKLYIKFNQGDLKVIRTIQYDSIRVQPKS